MFPDFSTTLSDTIAQSKERMGNAGWLILAMVVGVGVLIYWPGRK